ncbi:AAA domain-containing protein [Coprinopsis sp. MPI-PUGE-AT-0042]|nr:AAA domain-containing protein [Coprinopsis sp. MPI-PUGE-AT-0042]
MRIDLPIRTSLFQQVHRCLLNVGKAAESAETKAGNMVLFQLHISSGRSESLSRDMCSAAEASVIASLVTCILFCSPLASIMIATPKRSQREAVRLALDKSQPACRNHDSLEDAMANLSLNSDAEDVTVDTVERLQGSEASVVICTSTSHQGNVEDLQFLLNCRRLNVAFSRGKSLCILLATASVLMPPASVLADGDVVEGLGYINEFKNHAYCCDVFYP